jgi:flavin reductase (DIM6/NTAB) family NADH-FMN oxidoreductase RutF
MYKEIKVFDYANVVLEKMSPGIFLNTKKGEIINTMIIGWGGIFVVWGRPVFIVLVRESRATFELINSSEEFTVSIPIEKDMLEAIKICGTKSLREMNKFEVCNLTPIKGRKIETPIIKEATLHYECKVIYKQDLEQSVIIPKVKTRYYNQDANHTVYYGEILDQYLYTNEGE